MNSLSIRQRIVTSLILLGLGCSFVAALIQQETTESLAQHRLEEMAERTTRQIKQRMGRYEYGLRGIAGAVNGIGLRELNRERIGRYFDTRDLLEEFPGARGFGFIRRVSQSSTDTFLTQARLDGRPSFSLREIAPNTGDRWIIQYIEPYEANKGAEGLDIASESLRRNAAIQAASTGLATLTRPITLVQASGKKGGGFLLLFPIYASSKTPPT